MATPSSRRVGGARKKTAGVRTSKVASKPDEATVRRVPGKKHANPRDEPSRVTDDPVKAQRRVRDTFTMPARDYGLIAELKKRCRALGVDVKKSELLRAGLAALHGFDDERLRDLVAPLAAARGDRKAQDKRGKAA